MRLSSKTHSLLRSGLEVVLTLNLDLLVNDIVDKRPLEDKFRLEIFEPTIFSGFKNELDLTYWAMYSK